MLAGMTPVCVANVHKVHEGRQVSSTGTRTIARKTRAAGTVKLQQFGSASNSPVIAQSVAADSGTKQPFRLSRPAVDRPW
jgi:hypothetical protein